MLKALVHFVREVMLSRESRLVLPKTFPSYDDDDDDEDDDDDVVLYIYRAITPCYGSMLGALGRVGSFETYCQWASLSVRVNRLVTLPY